MPRDGEFHFISGDLPAIMVAALVFFVVNTSLVAAVIALVEGVGIWRYLVTDWFSQASTTGLMLGLSPIVVLAADYSLPLVTLLFLPLFAIHRGGRAAIAKEHQAVHDALTGLPNRVLFRDRVAQAIHTRPPQRERLQRDADGPRPLQGDQRHARPPPGRPAPAGGRRRGCASRCAPSDTVARLGGDEFGILLHGIADPVQAAIVAEALLERLREPFAVDATTLQVGGSIGVACHPEHGDDVETLIQRADIAMYAAKASSSGHAVFEAGQDHHSPRRLRLAAELRGAIERSELDARLPAEGRPADRQDRRRRGARALGTPRARHARAGRVRAARRADRPDHRADLLGARRGARARRVVARARPRHLGRRQPLRALVPRCRARRRDPRAARGSRPPAGRARARDHRVDADARSRPRALRRSSGSPRSASPSRVDDFGTGYSSLAHLKSLPVDTLKIDKSFVLDMDKDDADEAIVRSMIELAHNLGMRVVAEGVESAATWMRLGAMGCDLAQGFHLARPLPASGLLALLEAERDAPLRLVAR